TVLPCLSPLHLRPSSLLPSSSLIPPSPSPPVSPPSPFSSSSSLLICLLTPQNSPIENLDLNISVLKVSTLFQFGTFRFRSSTFCFNEGGGGRGSEEEGWRWRGGEGGSEVGEGGGQ
ncbi:hypothetical protein LINPERPRIM_LOCUS26724, partial [Linum perenne]